MRENRKILKSMYKKIDLIKDDIRVITKKYIAKLKPNEHSIYISDHAIVRFLERVKGVEFPDNSMSDEDKIKLYSSTSGRYIGYIRDEMLTIEEDRKILNHQMTYFHRENYLYVIKELCITTVLLN